MRRSPSGDTDGPPMARRELTAARPSKAKGQLPPLVEVIALFQTQEPARAKTH